MKNIANQYRQEKKDIQNKFIQYDLTEQQKQELTKSLNESINEKSFIKNLVDISKNSSLYHSKIQIDLISEDWNYTWIFIDNLFHENSELNIKHEHYSVFKEVDENDIYLFEKLFKKTCSVNGSISINKNVINGKFTIYYFENHIAFVAEKDTAINKCNSLAEKIIAITDPHTINNNCENEEAAKKEAYKMIKNEPLNMIEYLLNIIEENDITLG